MFSTRVGFLAMLSLCAALNAQNAISYNVAGASEQVGGVNPTYQGDAASHVTASGLLTSGISVPNTFSDLGGPGHWVFVGWPLHEVGDWDAPYIGMSLTALTPISPSTLSYTIFSGNWSDVWTGAPYLKVWASTDGFNSATLISQHNLQQTKPWTDTINNFTDDLTVLGTVPATKTLSIRWEAWYPAPYDRPN